MVAQVHFSTGDPRATPRVAHRNHGRTENGPFRAEDPGSRTHMGRADAGNFTFVLLRATNAYVTIAASG